MEINVSQLLQEPIGSTREYKLDEPADIIGDGNEYIIKGACRLILTRRGILVMCALDSTVELACSRCLGKYHYPLSIKFEEEFLPIIDIATGMPLPEPEEPSVLRIDEHHIIDLTEAIRQYAVMAVPMKPLCKKNCAGLCQACGKNLNEAACGCPVQDKDPRWSELTKLL